MAPTFTVMQLTDKPVLTRAEAAEYLSVSVDALAQMASRGDGPQFSKLSHRIVRYRLDDLNAWIEQNLTNSSRR